MRRHIAFVAGLPGEGQLLDQPAFGQHTQRGIDRSQGHRWKMLLHPLVDLLHRGVVGGIEHRLGNCQPLRSDPHAAGAQLVHHSVLYHRTSVRRIRAWAGAGAASFPTSIATARRYRKLSRPTAGFPIRWFDFRSSFRRLQPTFPRLQPSFRRKPESDLCGETVHRPNRLKGYAARPTGVAFSISRFDVPEHPGASIPTPEGMTTTREQRVAVGVWKRLAPGRNAPGWTAHQRHHSGAPDLAGFS